MFCYILVWGYEPWHITEELGHFSSLWMDKIIPFTMYIISCSLYILAVCGKSLFTKFTATEHSLPPISGFATAILNIPISWHFSSNSKPKSLIIALLFHWKCCPFKSCNFNSSIKGSSVHLWLLMGMFWFSLVSPIWSWFICHTGPPFLSECDQILPSEKQ